MELQIKNQKALFLLSSLFLSLSVTFGSTAVKATSSASTNPEILFISDLDDTIKLSQVLSVRGAITRLRDSHSWFLGMNDLYRLVKEDNPNIQFAYVSAAPKFLLEGSHEKLLQNGQFPVGNYFGRTNITSDNFKLIRIRQLLDLIKPQKVIFFGDNGEKDASVIQLITQEYKDSGIQFFNFIHIVYSKQNPKYAKKIHPTYPGQLTFVTPVEAALELRRRNLLSETSIRSLVDQLSEQILNEKSGLRKGVVAFPSFMDCRGYQWPDSLRSEALIRKMLAEDSRIAKLDLLKEKIQQRCSIPSIEDNQDDDDGDSNP